MNEETKEECMNTELQLCPFCGGGAELTSRFDVKCTACGAEMNSQTPEKDWNRRDGLQSAITAATAEAQTRIDHLEYGIAKQCQEIEQVLGKALGYPWFKDDQKNFPDATEKDGVCVGEHVPETIAAEAAKRIADLERQLAAIRRHNQESVQSDSEVASCNCLTKTPDIQYHAPGCKYRLIRERDELKRQLAEAKETNVITLHLEASKGSLYASEAIKRGVSVDRKGPVGNGRLHEYVFTGRSEAMYLFISLVETSQLRAANDEQAKEIERMREQFREDQELIGRIKNERQQKIAEAFNATQERDTLREQLAQVTREMENIDVALRGLTAEKDGLNTPICRERRVYNLGCQVIAAQEDCDHLRADLAAARERIEGMEKQLENKANDFPRGYFCAVAKLIETEGLTTASRGLFAAGGNPTAADSYDLDTFQRHGLVCHDPDIHAALSTHKIETASSGVPRLDALIDNAVSTIAKPDTETAAKEDKQP